MSKTARTENTSLRVSEEDVLRLQELARALGYLQPRGPGKRLGIGNISALLRAIAAGDVRLVKAADLTARENSEAHLGSSTP